MEGFNATATNVTEYQHGTPSWRTELTSASNTPPELKTPEVKMPFQGDYTQKKRGVNPKKVYLQSFLYDDILYWLKADPQFAAQAMYLDETGDTPETFETAVANLTRYVEDGLKFIAPPLPYLVKAKDGKIVPSEYAIKARKLGLDIITWSLERSGPLENGANGDYYYYSIASVVNNDGDVYKLLDVFRQIGVFGVFSDWSSTVTYYANCFGIKLRG
ncbi:hypothetical protein NM208_g13193 [Fusarium decemcellulare]|uniref:Uncharacterized protein n=1 Tax=Fusarium decemcellulare TaxID=57161 RepID=A0ACC1RP92_9HYPO|nr:hypothetical protein NM208_g13193 [Fusarium decemcellulare]